MLIRDGTRAEEVVESGEPSGIDSSHFDNMKGGSLGAPWGDSLRQEEYK